MQDRIDAIKELIGDFDFPSANQLASEIIDDLDCGSVAFTRSEIRALLAAFRGARQFETLAHVAQALMRAGYDDRDWEMYEPHARRQYAQALIEMGHLGAAIDTLKAGIADLNDLLAGRALIDLATRPKEVVGGFETERGEMLGLLGRANKQIYMDGAATPRRRRAAKHLAPHLADAIRFYGSAAENRDPARDNAQAVEHGHWPLMNMVALAARRERDGGTGELAADWKGIASDIRETLCKRVLSDGAKADPWMQASLGEACIATGKFDDAMRWYVASSNHPHVDAFQIASAIRQLVEVWGIDPESTGGGGAVIQALKACLTDKPGGGLLLGDNASHLLDMIDGGAAQSPDGLRKQSLIDGHTLEHLKTLRTGIDQARAVAGVYAPYTERPIGTAFLVSGRELHASFGDRPVLLTAAHVISNAPGAVPPEKAVLQFNEFGGDTTASRSRFRCAKALFVPETAALDFTVVEIAEPVEERFHVATKPTDEIPRTIHGLSPAERRCWVLGHADGGDLSLALDNSKLLDIGYKHSERDSDHYLRYSASTLPGQSGGPVFDRNWRLIGLHQAGIDPRLSKSGIRRLSGKPGRHVANEGLSLRTIVDTIARAKRGATVPGANLDAVPAVPATVEALAAAIQDPATIDATVEAWFQDPTVQEMVEWPADDRQLEGIRNPGDVFGYGAIVGVSQALRFRRNIGFDKKRTDPARTHLSFVSEGDSWFQFPLITVKDTIDHLSQRYPIYCRAIAGMEISSILADTDDVMQAIRDKQPDGVLLSGGGNDLLGNGNVKNFVHKFDPDREPKDYLIMNRLEPEIGKIISLFDEFVADAREIRGDLKFFLHGYDRAQSRNNGKWLRKPLRDGRKIANTGLQNAIVAAIVDRFNDALEAFAARNPGIVHYIDCRGTARSPADWFDELHPSSEGFARIAQRFDGAIRTAFKGHPALAGKINRLNG